MRPKGYDIFAAVFLLILFSPVMIATSILIKLTSSGPVLADIPQRVGQGGKLFRLYKFRSMFVNAHNLMKTDPNIRSFIGNIKIRAISFITIRGN